MSAFLVVLVVLVQIARDAFNASLSWMYKFIIKPVDLLNTAFAVVILSVCMSLLP